MKKLYFFLFLSMNNWNVALAVDTKKDINQLYKINIYYHLVTKPSRRIISNTKKIIALQKADCMSNGVQTTPLAETAWQRGTLKPPSLSLNQARLHAAAQLSQDTNTAQQILNPELTATDVNRAFAAALTLAFVTVKANPSLRGKAVDLALDQLDNAAKAANITCSDCAYLQALRAWYAGDKQLAYTFVNQARALEPSYFNALALNAILLVENFGLSGQQEQSCRDNLADLMNVIVDLAAINPCPLQASHLDILISRYTTYPEDNSAVQAIRLILGKISRNSSVVQAALNNLEHAHDLHPTCLLQLINEAKELVTSGR